MKNMEDELMKLNKAKMFNRKVIEAREITSRKDDNNQNLGRPAVMQ